MRLYDYDMYHNSEWLSLDTIEFKNQELSSAI